MYICIYVICTYTYMHSHADPHTHTHTQTLSSSNQPPKDLSKTFFERVAYACISRPIMLAAQYRCHPKIANLASRLFYHNRVVNGLFISGGVTVAGNATASDGQTDCNNGQSRHIIEAQISALAAVCHLPTVSAYDTSSAVCRRRARVSGGEKTDMAGSIFDATESKCVVALVKHLVGKPSDDGLTSGAGLDSDDLGVICMYRAQANRVNSDLRELGIEGVKVSTVDAFQGEERDVVIVCVTKSTNVQTAHVCSARRVNVAITVCCGVFFLVYL